MRNRDKGNSTLRRDGIIYLKFLNRWESQLKEILTSFLLVSGIRQRHIFLYFENYRIFVNFGIIGNLRMLKIRDNL